MLHTMAQRSSGVGTRARSRWQPYNSTLITSTSRSSAPYLNTPVSAVSTSPPHSTHLNVRHTHTPPDITQRKPRQATTLIGKSKRASRFFLHLARGSDQATFLCVDHAVRSLSEIWQDDYLSVYTTTKVATQPLEASGYQESVWHVWNPAIQRHVQQLPSPPPPSKPPAVSPSTISQCPRPCPSFQETRCRSASRFRAGALLPFPHLTHGTRERKHAWRILPG